MGAGVSSLKVGVLGFAFRAESFGFRFQSLELKPRASSVEDADRSFRVLEICMNVELVTTWAAEGMNPYPKVQNVNPFILSSTS